MKKAWLLLLILVAVFGFSGAGQGATLTLIGTANYEGEAYNLIYMDDGPLGPITWLDYVSNWCTWQNQVDWASNLSFAEADIQLNPGYTTSVDWSTGWRLPETPVETWGYNITSSEMGYLFYEALDKGMDINLFWQPGFVGFVNLQGYSYWSGTEVSSYPDAAWFFTFNIGHQWTWEKSGEYEIIYALAVRPGYVFVPEPSAILLIGTGIIGLAVFRKKFKKY